MRYRYVAYAAEGGRVRGVLEADSEQGAEEQLYRDNMTVVSVERQAQGPRLEQLFPSLFGVRSEDVISFSRGLASLLDSGISIVAALQMLHAQAPRRMMKDVIRQMVAHLGMGESLSQALARHPGVFPSLMVRLVQIGEGIGNLSRALNEMASYTEKTTAARKKVLRAMSYPSFVLLLGVGAIFLLLTLVIPSMQNLFREFGGQLPTISRLTIQISGVLKANMGRIFLTSMTLLVLAVVYFRTAEGKRRKDKLLLRLPPFNRIVVNSTLARLSRTLALLLGSGVPLRESMEMVINTTESAPYRESLKAAHGEIMRGQLFSEAMRDQPLFPPMFSRMVAMGEASGGLQANLESLAKNYEEEMDRSISTMLGLVEPTLLMFVGGTVAFVAISIMQPLYGVIRTIR